MNRTRKYEAAAIGVAVILAIIAMVAFTPNLHTQTPVSTAPPASGGTNTGGGSTSGTGTGAGNGTATTCNVTGDDHAWDNETDGNWNGTHGWDDANPTNGTGDHGSEACNATAGDHDGMGDQASDGHHGHGEDDLVVGAMQDALSLVPALSVGLAAAWNALVSVTGTFVHGLVGLVSSGTAS